MTDRSDLPSPPPVQELFNLRGRVAIITGGSRGLGLEIAEGLGEAGAAVAISARRDEWLSSAEDHLKGLNLDVLAVTSDVTQPDQVDAFIRQVLDRFGHIDILVNNAGVSWGAAVMEMPLEKWRQVLETNLTGMFLMTQAAGERMIVRGYGKIINIASIAGLKGTPPDVLDAIGYSTAKGGVIAFTRDLAVKWAPHNVYVNAIAPSFFRTRMTEAVLKKAEKQIEALTPLGRVGRPGELKGVAVFLASAASDYITGQVIAVDGGITAA